MLAWVQSDTRSGRRFGTSECYPETGFEGAWTGSIPRWRLPVNMDCSDAPNGVSGVSREESRGQTGRHFGGTEEPQ